MWLTAEKAREITDERLDYLEEVKSQLQDVEDKIRTAAKNGKYKVYVSLYGDGFELYPEAIEQIKDSGYEIKAEEEKLDRKRYVGYHISWRRDEEE